MNFKILKAREFTVFLNEGWISDKILVSKGIQKTNKLYRGVTNRQRFRVDQKLVEYWSTKRSVASTYSKEIINKTITLNNAVVIDFKEPIEFNDVGHTLRDVRAKFKEVLKTKIPYKGYLRYLPTWELDIAYEIPGDCDGIIFRNLIDTSVGGWDSEKNTDRVTWEQRYLSEVWLIALNTPIQESTKREEELERTEIFKDEVDGIRNLLKKFKERSKGIEDYLQAVISKDREYTKRKSMKDKIFLKFSILKTILIVYILITELLIVNSFFIKKLVTL